MVKRLGGPAKTRTRRSVDDARRLILDAAQKRLIAGGPDAVRVQTVAADVGLTDAAVHYHFGNRDGLMEALVADAGRRLRHDLRSAVEAWVPGTLDLSELARRLRHTMDAEGHARLTAWMTLNGWQPHGEGGLRSTVQALHQQRIDIAQSGREPPAVEDSLFCVELIALVVWAEALVGHAWRLAVGLPADRATAERFLGWFTDLLEDRFSGTGRGLTRREAWQIEGRG
jgi:TetR/AcrR family transcriptional regulator, repressor for neighboring sulfatase